MSRKQRVRFWRRRKMQLRPIKTHGQVVEADRAAAAAIELRRGDIRELIERQEVLPKPVYLNLAVNKGGGRAVWSNFLRAPADFDFDTNFAETMSFIEELRRLAFVERRWSRGRRSLGGRIVADLTPIKRITIDGALVIAAEFDRIRRAMKFRPSMEDKYWEPWLRDAMDQMGFYDLVSCVRRTGGDAPKAYTFGQQFVKFISDHQTEPALANGLLTRLSDVCGGTPERRALYAGLLEAIENVGAHAYRLGGNREYLVPYIGKWWAGGGFIAKTQRLHISVYDQGFGIPATIRQNEFLSFLMGNDGQKIAQALEYGKTSTGQKGRGNGLWQIAGFVELRPGSNVHIYSGAGYVKISTGGNVVSRPLPANFGGTLIHWDIDLKDTVQA